MDPKINLKTIRRTMSDTDSDYPEREPLLTPACSSESKKSLNGWGQLPIPPTALFNDSETSDFEATSVNNNNINTENNKTNDKMYQKLRRNLGQSNQCNYNVRGPQFDRGNSNQIFSYSNKYTKYNTISYSSESDLHTRFSPVDGSDRLYCSVASMIPAEEDKTGKTDPKRNSFVENGTRRSIYKSSEIDELSNKPKQSSIVTIFSIWNTMVGTTLLAMPWGMERAGLPAGFVIAVIMGGICLYSAYCNINVQEHHGAPDGEVSDLARQFLGKWAEVIAKIFSLLVLLGAVIIYWILLSNFLNFIVEYAYHLIFGYHEVHPQVDPSSQPGVFDDAVLCPKFMKGIMMNETEKDSSVKSVHTFDKYWNLSLVPIYLAVIVGPIICVKSPTFFTKFTSLGTLSVMFLMVFVFIKAVIWGFINVTFVDNTSTNYAPFIKSTFPVICGMLSLSYFIHNIIISIMKNNRHQENNARDLSVAYLLVIMTYSFIGSLFYVSFPLAKHCIEDNILNNFRVNDPLSVIARVFLFFQLLTVYPLIAFLLRSQVLTELTGSADPRYVFILLFNLVLMIICILFAIFVPRIGVVIRFTGALSGFVHVFSLPILLRIASLKKRGKLTTIKLILHLVIPILGGINIIMQFLV